MVPVGGSEAKGHSGADRHTGAQEECDHGEQPWEGIGCWFSVYVDLGLYLQRKT